MVVCKLSYVCRNVRIWFVLHSNVQRVFELNIYVLAALVGLPTWANGRRGRLLFVFVKGGRQKLILKVTVCISLPT